MDKNNGTVYRSRRRYGTHRNNQSAGILRWFFWFTFGGMLAAIAWELIHRGVEWWLYR